MCSKLNSCVRTEEGLTSYFPCTQGTRQGDIGSPLIFVLLTNDLCDYIRKECGRDIFITNQIPDIHALLFADDVANCADTVQQLQKQICAVFRFCSDYSMHVNVNKTQIVVFRN